MHLDPTGPHLATLDALAVIEIRGDDRKRWLQGQITQDVNAAPHGGTIHGFHLDAQGKILAELRLVEQAESYVGVVDVAVADALVRDLDRRIVMEDVELARRQDLAVLGVYGDSATSVGVDPGVVATIESDRFGLEGIELVVPRSEADAIRARLSSAVRARGGGEASTEALDAVRTELGMPRFVVDFAANTLPQETGLHRRTVSFVKGCYVGQEPVVMIEHRGKPPRRMCVVSLAAPRALPFDLLRADGSVAGRCTSLTATSAGALGLALVKRSSAESDQPLRAEDAEVRILRLVEFAPGTSPTPGGEHRKADL